MIECKGHAAVHARTFASGHFFYSWSLRSNSGPLAASETERGRRDLYGPDDQYGETRAGTAEPRDAGAVFACAELAKYPPPTRIGYVLPVAFAMWVTGLRTEAAGAWVSCMASIASLAGREGYARLWPDSVITSPGLVHQWAFTAVVGEVRAIRTKGAILRTLIVDDEPVARSILREELATIIGIEVIGEAENGQVALEKIRADHPDLVLLDLQMPIMGGFDVVRRLDSGGSFPAIVIVTAFDRYAIQAFESGAVDYLLKPVSHERLAIAVDRARRASNRETAERIARIQEIAEPLFPEDPRNKPVRKIVGRSGSDYVLLNAEEIFAFQAEGELVWIITSKNKLLATQTLKALEDKLIDTNFRRIHRSALVNIDRVRKMSTLSSQRWLVTLANNLEFIVSKRQAKSIRHLVNW
jgi:two-component system, LytTR family, response regulator